MFKTILVATDGSPPAEKAVRLAGQLAAAHEARLVLTYVIDQEISRDELRHFAEAEHLGSGYPARRGRDAIIMPHGEVPLPTTSYGGEEIDWTAAEETVGKRLLQQAAESAREAGARQVDVAVERGDVAEAILQVAEQRKADAIVLGSRGRGGLQAVVFGSVSKKVAEQAKTICVTVT